MAGIESPTTGNGLEIDSGFRAARVSVRPPEILSWISLGVQSGALATTTAGGSVFAFRNLSAKLILVRRIGVGFIAATGYTAAQRIDLGLQVARNYTVSESAGTPITVTGANGKHRTSLTTPSSLDIRIAATGQLTAGVRTLDVNTLSQIGGFAAAAATGVIIAPALGNLFSHDTGDYPLVLAQNEGFVITTPTALGAGGVAALYVNLEFAECDSF